MNGNGVLLLAVNESQRLQFSQGSAQGLLVPEFQAGCLVVQLDNQTLYYWNGEAYEILASTGGSGPGVASLNSLIGALNIVAGSNITVTPAGQNITIASTGGGGGSGTVTSVGLTVPSYLSVSGSPITTAGTLAISGVSQTANYFLASPNGSSGALSPRAIVAADIPTLNQNTSGTAANITATSNSTLVTLSSLSLPYSQVTGGPSPVTPGGTSGQIQFNNAGAFGGFGSWDGTTFNLTGNIVTSGTLYIGSSSQFVGNIQASGGLGVSGNLGFYGATQIAQPSGDISTALANLGLVAAGTLAYSELTGAPTYADSIVNTAGVITLKNDTATPAASQYYGTNGSSVLGYYNLPSGTVSSVGLSSPGVLYSVSGSPVTTSGTLALNLISQAANTVLASPNGSSGTPSFRSLVGTDIPIDNNTLFVNGSNQIAVQYSTINTTNANYFFGFHAGNASATGTTDVGFGDSALFALTSGYSNSAFGYAALSAVTSGFYNTAVGSVAATLLTTGNSNTAVGYNSLSSAVSTNGNTAIGREALKATTGNSNTSVGYESLFYNTTGTNNTAIGYQAGHSSAGLITATDITLLGAATGNSGSDGITNSTAVGYGATINASNQIVLGNTSVTAIQTGTPSVLWNGSSPMTTAGDIEYYSSGVQRLPIGTTGQVLSVAGGIPTWQAITASQITGGPIGYGLISNGGGSAPTWQPLPGTVSAFFASSQVTTDSSTITANTFTTPTGSPAFTFTPTITGTYKVYSSIPLYSGANANYAITRIFNTSGSAILLEESQGVAVSFTAGVDQLLSSAHAQSVYTLTAGTSYVFDIQLKSSAGSSVNFLGSSTPFYMFAELEVAGTSGISSSGSSFITSGVTYTTPGTITTSTVFKFVLIGGGGGGGGINTASANGSGGGGGQVVTVYATGLSPSTAYTIAIGGAGTGGISTTTPATAGGNTTISLDSITYTAAGGGAGADTVSTAGGAGGNSANTFGTGFSTGGFQVQGQSGRGSTLANADSFSGDGGAAMGWGAGGAPYTSSTAGNGNPGTGYGGGGSGGRGAAATGGAGAAGAILVEYHN